MTAIRPVNLICDGELVPECETINACIEATHPGETVAEVRAQLRAVGWSYSGGKDWCPACRAARRKK